MEFLITTDAWTAAYKGRPFGCCSGQGGYEDCLEQHITGDIGVAAWKYYQSTHNKTWLQYTGWPILKNIADWILSRVTPKPSLNDNVVAYNIDDVLPVDEWCVGAGCGCETPGVNNDAQTNAVNKLSLQYAFMAAEILNIAQTDQIKLYNQVGNNMIILFNNTMDMHNQFNSSLCPNGNGGQHYEARHTVCPEDVMYLSYPLGDALNITKTVTENDYNHFVPVTCQENAGMTTPIHSITQLMLKNPDYIKVEYVFNRSMYAASYGAYNIRNEVDKHPNIIGGHFDNTHFLTGNGGFLQQFLYGFSGIKIVENGLKVERSYLPNTVGMMRLRKLNWRQIYLTVSITAVNVTIQVSELNEQSICLIDGNGHSVPLKNDVFFFEVSGFVYPGILTNQCT